MLFNIPFSRNLQELQKNLEKMLRDYLAISFNPFLDIIHQNGHYHVHMDKIAYIERCGRVTEVHATDGMVYRSYRPVYKYQELLPESMFCRISCGVIVNWRFLQSVKDYRAKIIFGKKPKIYRAELPVSTKVYQYVKAELTIRSNVNS